MRDTRNAIQLEQGDNVATLLRAVEAGGSVDTGLTRIKATESIPLCHKIALVDLPSGAEVIKYGMVIGETTGPIARGSHVHVHNMQSLRGRER